MPGENMKNNSEEAALKIVRKFNVVPDVVFDAFTKPEAMQVWWTDETTFDIDLRAGGKWTITRVEGDQTYVMTGEYLEVDRPYRLLHTIGMPQYSPNFDTISIHIKPEKDGCVLIFEQSGTDIKAELAEMEPGEQSTREAGWQQGFDLMEAAWDKH
jgi:uncharacterized protein YndB with AHSA1/START domain